MADEFIPISLVGILAIFASGFFLSQGIEDVRHGLPAAGDFFLAIMFSLIAREGAKDRFKAGTYTRRFLIWRRRIEPDAH